VFEEVFEQAYQPFVALLERHPAIRVSLHYTGPLLQWLVRERPAFVDRVRDLVERAQVELLGGGFYEPVLATLHERDRVAQLRRMGDELEALTGRRPQGAWLAERVWEPSLPTSLVDAGYGWTIVDDVHLRSAGVPDDAHWAGYTTDDQGRRLTVFGTEQGLRYLIPFQTVPEVMRHLREHATPEGDRLGTMGDDGEKFGAWPTTFEHCWGRGRWMDEFFEALEANADWLTTVTPSAWLAEHPPIERVYMPTSSYTEMTEWVLPPAEAIAFGEALRAATHAGRPDARFLRGGFWRNFQRRYREINDLHKQMLRASDAVDAMAGGPDRTRALDHLLQGQSNDCYWHGLFGGIYITHMRLASFEHLIAAEDAAWRAGGSARGGSGSLRDVDLDGRDEAFFGAPGQIVTVKLDQGAGIGEWDVRAARHALAAVMRRRPEASHERLRAAEQDQTAVPAASDDAVESIHEIATSKEPGLASLLFYDAYERRSGLLHLLDPSVTPQAFIEGRFAQLAAALDAPYTLSALTDDGLEARCDAPFADGTLAIRKTIRLGGDRLDPTLALAAAIDNRSSRTLRARVGLEWSVMLLGGGGNPAAYYLVDEVRSAHDSAGQSTGIASLESGNEHVGLRLRTELEPAGDAWWAPIETISSSEAGFERVYQGSSLLLSWLVTLEPGATWRAAITQRVAVSRDHAAEEARP
jgi:alpha-amylase